MTEAQGHSSSEASGRIEVDGSWDNGCPRKAHLSVSVERCEMPVSIYIDLQSCAFSWFFLLFPHIRASILCVAFRENWNVQADIQLLGGLHSRGSRGKWCVGRWLHLSLFQLCWSRNFIQQDTQKLIVLQMLSLTIQTHDGQACKPECQFIHWQGWIFLYRDPGYPSLGSPDTRESEGGAVPAWWAWCQHRAVSRMGSTSLRPEKSLEDHEDLRKAVWLVECLMRKLREGVKEKP